MSHLSITKSFCKDEDATETATRPKLGFNAAKRRAAVEAYISQYISFRPFSSGKQESKAAEFKKRRRPGQRERNVYHLVKREKINVVGTCFIITYFCQYFEVLTIT